jgi:hypothetical protein
MGTAWLGRVCFLAVAGAACLSGAGRASADDAAIATFYKGKTITILVGSSAGGGYDTYARLIARHMTKHMPGNPTVIVSNMPGAGSNVAANYIYNAAAKDGTMIGALYGGSPLEPLIGTTPVQHDPSKSQFLGSANNDVYVCVARKDARVELAAFEHAVRNDLNTEVPRVLCVLNPLKVVLTNYPEGQVEDLDAPSFPPDVPKTGSRTMPFSRELYVDRDDFMEDPPKKFYRLTPGKEVRLRFGYLITCNEVVKNDAGDVIELRCTYDPATRSGQAPDGRKVQGTIHWVSAAQALSCEVRVYDRLFSQPDPDAVPEGQDFISTLNPQSLVVIPDAKIEPSVANDPIGSRYQFERTGYFMSEVESSTPEKLVFNRIVGMRDSWAKEVKRS